MFADVTREAEDCRHAFLSSEVNIRGYAGVRPFSAASDPFKLQLSAVEVADCLDRLYAKPVEQLRQQHNEVEAMIEAQLLRATSPEDYARCVRAEQHAIASVSGSAQPVAAMSPSKFAQRFYTGPLAVKAAHRQTLEHKYLDDASPAASAAARVAPRPLQLKGVHMSADDARAFLERLYNRRATPDQISLKAEQKVYAEALRVAEENRRAGKGKFHTKAEQQAAVMRLYDERVAELEKRRRARERRLLWRSRGEREGTTLTLSSEQLSAMLRRLGGEGAGGH